MYNSFQGGTEISKHILPPYELRQYKLQVRLADYERRAFAAAAEQEAMSVSEWTVDRGVISATFAANLGQFSGWELGQIG